MDVQRTGYTGFGSFHSDNVEELIRQPDDVYQEPTIPTEVCLPEFSSYDTMMTSLLQPLVELGGDAWGKALLDKGIFLLDKKWTFLNHGAFGATAYPVLRAAEYWRRYTEAQPLLAFDRVLLPQLVRIVRMVSRRINAHSCADVVLSPNATQALWSAIQTAAAAMEPDDVIMTMDICYGSVKRMVAKVVELHGLKHHVVCVALPPAVDATSADVTAGILACVEQALQSDACRTAKVMILDAITSNTALKLPLEALTALCHRHSVAVIVDAAHALGQIDVDVQLWNPDIVIGNFHKWWCSARGAAFMAWNSRAAASEPERFHIPQPRSLVVSHGYGHGMLSEFSWDGNRDYSAWLSLDAAEQFWNALGADRARTYCVDLLREAARLLVMSWSTRTLVPLDMSDMMALVKLPMPAGRNKDTDTTPSAYTSTDSKFIQDTLHYKYCIEVPVKCVAGQLWVRISAAVYNSLDDYKTLDTAIVELCQDYTTTASGK